MNISQHHAIGEGRYGCVVNPSLKCSDNNIIHPPNSVSKIMKEQDAIDEMEEIKEIDKIDPTYNFHIPTPTLCKLDKKQNYESNINGCEKISVTSQNIDSLSILTMQNSGSSFYNIMQKYRYQLPSQENQNYMNNLWLSLIPIFEGLITMQQNMYQHHDISINNILFNEQTNKSVLIDFGNAALSIRFINNNLRFKPYKFFVWWSQPVETHYIPFSNYKEEDPPTGNAKLFSQVFSLLIPLGSKQGVKLKKKLVADASKSFKKIKQLKTTEENKEITIAINKIRTRTDINNIYTNFKEPYINLLRAHIKTYDTYGLGLACMTLLLRTEHLISSPIRTSLFNAFYQMIHPDPLKRIEPKEAAKQYKQCLKKANITKMKVLATNVVSSSTVSSSRSLSNNFGKTHNTLKSNKLSIKKCPDKKELNPLTNRCRNKCLSQKYRNKKGNCVNKPKSNKHTLKLISPS